MTRSVGSDVKLPTGGSPGALGGDDPAFARQDHIHGLWHEWEPLELSTGWIPNGTFWLPSLGEYKGLRVAKAANTIEVNGMIEFDGDATTTTAPNLITTLPVECRPEEDITVSCYSIIPFPLILALPGFIVIQVGANGDINYLDTALAVAPMNIYTIMFMNFIFRTDYA